MKTKNTSFLSSHPQSNSHGVYDQINSYFSGQDQQSKTVLEAREILGKSANSLSDEEVYELVTEMQYLVDGWLEEYEKTVFDGKTLKELVRLE